MQKTTNIAYLLSHASLSEISDTNNQTKAKHTQKDTCIKFNLDIEKNNYPPFMIYQNLIRENKNILLQFKENKLGVQTSALHIQLHVLYVFQSTMNISGHQ